MLNTTDLYLGTFLILCGFALSLLNLRRVVKGGAAFSKVLLSENILLMCIGIAFVSRSVYALHPSNMDILDMEERTAELVSSSSMDCGFTSLLLGYGPLVVPMVNSFLSLVIDNYMHYKMLGNIKEKSDEDVVREVGEESVLGRKIKSNKCDTFCMFYKKYFSFVAISVQWIVPIVFALAMYPMGVEEITISQARSVEESCMALLDFNNKNCNNIIYNANDNTIDLPKYFQSPVNFLEAHENHERKSNDSDQIDLVLSNVLRIINNFNNHTNFNYAAIKSLRQPKMDENCVKMCFTDNRKLMVYMFVLLFVSYFIPITISMIILTKIHVMDVKKPIMKTYVTRELLYNILFWTPVMFDSFISLMFCSYSTYGVRTSMFNVIANIYQAVKNFMNTKYLKENVIVPV